MPDRALNAASAIGDDRLQQQGRGHVTPDSFTHGSSAQRVEWFRRGFSSGNLEQCNTFQAAALSEQLSPKADNWSCLLFLASDYA